ncbi:uncharacterized protein LOC110231309 [Exaiptasia diaphana]|uniref:Uncharacterized protein n=1 Tax=Exaiptasia diaphana TaxID=2652724 RepID=A0A913WP66_EXADI|nr:uncharacterized protein LOC110231309 [Exaiptasia diaphana]KXJ19091.1 hypothetical protein AC249_AIPGENE11770 [Exaiptasia diaphana]
MPTTFHSDMKNPLQNAVDERSKKLEMEFISEHKMDHNFNALLVGKPFRYTDLCVITGGDDGTIRVFTTKNNLRNWNLEEISKLESKGGPVQCLHLHNVTKFGSCDMIVGDSKGTLTIFSNEQILNRRILSQDCIIALTVDVDHAGNLAIVVGDGEGGVTAVSPYGSLWKIRLQDARKQMYKEIGQRVSVKCMLSVQLPAANGLPVSYIIVSDTCKNIFILQNGMVVHTLHMTSVVTAMTSGYFIPIMPPPFSPTQSFSSPRSLQPARQSQVALGTEEGSIFVLSNFQLQPYASVRLPITNLLSFPNNGCPEKTDFLLCSGHFNALMVFDQQEIVHRLETKEWIHTVSCSYDDKHVVLGMLDNTISIYRLASI